MCAGVTVVITGYLLFYFYVYQDGCEELIKFWVLSNLMISISFTALRMAFIFVKLGKTGLKRALSKRPDS